MMDKSPFRGDGAGKGQISGSKDGLSSISENTGPAGKSGSHSASHPKPGGKTQGPSGDIGHADSWNPKG